MHWDQPRPQLEEMPLHGEGGNCVGNRISVKGLEVDQKNIEKNIQASSTNLDKTTEKFLQAWGLLSVGHQGFLQDHHASLLVAR